MKHKKEILTQITLILLVACVTIPFITIFSDNIINKILGRRSPIKTMTPEQYAEVIKLWKHTDVKAEGEKPGAAWKYAGNLLIILGSCGFIYGAVGYSTSKRQDREPKQKEKIYKYHLENGKFTIKPKE
jgi:predicted membrane-bound mannosyltransferase